ncbi:MAG: response regulator [Butyrivibrio sp.]|nr:response regulator [Butyrivibrio sp.]
MDNLYKIMIVDDERIVRDAIASSVEWENHGIEFVFSAANALEALDYIENNDVDLMLVDIRMPVIDGIELIKRVREKNKKIDCIILSGHAEFEYAQQAVHYGAKDYLLKPIEEETLLQAINTCKEKALRNKQLNMASKFASMEIDEYSKYSKTVAEILQIVDEEISNVGLTLKSIASERLFLNENYLSKLFQKETGTKFSTYLQNQRMTLAMKMLIDKSDPSIQEVAASCGYGDNSQYFAICFKKHCGMTPSEYKRTIKGGY